MDWTKQNGNASGALAEIDELVAPAQPSGEQWPEPEPLGGKLPPVDRLRSEMLPESLRAMVKDVAERMQVPLDFPGVVAVQTLAGVVGRRAIIQPKQRDTDWTEVPNLWGGIVAEPGSMKSPVISAITTAAREVERQWQQECEIATQDHKNREEVNEIALQAWKDKAKKASMDGKATPERPMVSSEAPSRKRLLSSDATYESLHAILAANPAGLFVLRDELTGWLAGLEQKGHEKERTFYLEAWNGNTPHTVDRIGRGSVRVDNTCVSLFGGIQPSRLRDYLAETLQGGPSNDGLIQRFQLLIWPDPRKETWRYIDQVPDAAAQSQAAAVYKRLALMETAQPVRFRFHRDAQELFIEWLTELEGRICEPGTGDVMRAHLAKYRKLMPALALLFALADGAEQLVTPPHATLAAAWCAYLEGHARRIYSAQATPQQAAAALLGQRLIDGQLGHTFTLRDVHRKHWSGLSTPEDARAACRYLEELNWLRRLPQPKGKIGRQQERFVFNPRVEQKHADN